MLTPPPRPPRNRSPKEDGEIGETAQDVIVRNPNITPGMRALINKIREVSDVPEIFTPGVAAAVGRCLSAAMSPMSCKADPKDAKEALELIATEMLPERKSKVDQMAAEDKARLEEAAAAAAAALEAARTAHGAAVAARRPTAGSAERVPKQRRTNHGYLEDA